MTPDHGDIVRRIVNDGFPNIEFLGQNVVMGDACS
jgi:hypothetical protein